MRMRVMCERSFVKNCVSLYIGQELQDGRIGVAQPLTFVAQDRLLAITEPVFDMDATTAQSLIDELWRAGLRPTEGAGSAGAMAATERHLKDLQRLVFAESQVTK